MYIIVDKINNEYGVLDTYDDTIEYYSENILRTQYSSVNILGLNIDSINLLKVFKLMNKNNCVAYFTIKELQYSEPIYEFINDSIKLLPYALSSGYLTLSNWLSSRLLINERFDVKEMLELLGISSIVQFIEVTHLVSLNDTFWVKNVFDKSTWYKVSPYINKFNDVIANYSFNKKINSKFIGDSSPDLSLGGSFPKCWRRKNNVIELIKGGTTGAFNAGLEPFSEIYTYQLAKYLGFNDILEYKYISYNNLDCTRCKLMTSEDVGLINAREFTGQNTTDYNLLFSLLDDSEQRKLRLLLTLDCLSFNVDRHFGNIGLFINNNTQNLISLSTIYDNNFALLPYYVPSFDDEYDYITSLRAKNGQTFKELYDSIRTSETDYLVKKALSFRFKSVINSSKMSVDRLNILTELVHKQAKLLLSGGGSYTWQ